MRFYTSLFIRRCFNAYISLYSLVSLILEYWLVALLVLLFESVFDSNGKSFDLSVRVRISIHPCKLFGFLPSMYVYMDLSFLCVVGEWHFVK